LILCQRPGTRAFNDANCSGITNRFSTEDVVVIDAKHLCVNSRGISDIESSTVTSEFGGKFKDNVTRREFWIISN
jgi:GTP cyclohydrolase I